MTDYRLIDLGNVQHLARFLDGCVEEALSVAAGLDRLGDHHAETLRRVGSKVAQCATFVRTKSAAADPASDRSVSGPTTSTTVATGLQPIIRTSRAAAWVEIRRVVEALTRFSAIGVHTGRIHEGLKRDYETLVELVGTNLVHFAVDESVPIGSRSSRAGYRAGVWIGPDDPDHVLVMIPGMATTTQSWLDDSVPDAIRLQTLASDLATDHRLGTVAVVPLLAYGPPQNLLEAPLGHFWRDGATETSSALARLPLEGRHVVGWGHSYGAAVLGATSAIGSQFDDLIMVGAAGTGTESIDELGVNADHLFVATNWNDPIRLVPNDYHGVSPATLPHIDIPTSPETDFDSWKAMLNIPWFLADGLPDHDYLEDATAMRAFAAVTVGYRDLDDL